MSEKNAIVLLPGMDGTGELLRPLAKRLSTYRPVHLIDYPVDRFLNYDQLVLYVKARLPDDRFVILGESFSGPVAIEIAATESKAAGLILAASFAKHPLPTLLTAFTGLLDLRWIPTSIIVAALMGSAATLEIKRKLRQVLAALPGDILRARAREVLRVDKLKRLDEITCPMLCLHGRSDCLVRKKFVDEIVAARPDCQVQLLDSSHMLLAIDADAAAAVIEAFCGELDRRVGCRRPLTGPSRIEPDPVPERIRQPEAKLRHQRRRAGAEGNAWRERCRYGLIEFEDGPQQARCLPIACEVSDEEQTCRRR